MSVQDRGTMKWVSLMLPEHVALLEEAFIEYNDRPILDEQQMTEIDRRLKFALEEQAELKMTYYRTGDTHVLYGRLMKIDQWNGYIVLRNEDGATISLQDIVDVELTL